MTDLATAAAGAEKRGEIELAIRVLSDLLLLDGQPATRLRLARLLQQQGRLDEALAELRLAYAADTNSLEVVNTLAEVLVELGRAAESVPLLQRTLADRPRDVQTLCNLGLAHAGLRQWGPAVDYFERATALSRGNAVVLCNLGNALQGAGRALEALPVFARAAQAQPALGVLHANMAGTLLALGRVDEALACYANRLVIDPRDAAAYSDLLFAMNYSDRVTPEQMATAHRRFSEQVEQPLRAQRPRHRNLPDPLRRLRVGYLSSDLRNHSVAYFAESVLAHHDRSQFELFAYANHTGNDAITQRLKPLFACWRPVLHLYDAEAARLIQADGIDVLIDLNGHTGGNRLAVVARKPAPVQVTWLGYPNTTGLEAVDFRLTDAWADPPGQTEQWHSETLWRLPGCFVCYRPPADAPDVAARPAASPQAVAFGSLNNHNKISPGVVAAWSRILGATAGSRLVLKLRGNNDASIRDSLIRGFVENGIAVERLTVLGRLDDASEHLRRYGGIDIALDTFPYAGTTTTCDALWMGVPVVTLAGRTHASCVGASLLHAVELGQLVAANVDGYVDAAVRLARDPLRLQALRTGLRERVTASALTDGARFTLNFEAALRQMWAGWCRNAGRADEQGSRAALAAP